MKKLLIILGNGFTIDLVKQMKKEAVIDVKNLFRLGHTVKFPDTHMPSFLSYQHCPSLWLLGARPNKTDSESMSIIEEIITCSNMLFEYLNWPSANEKRIKLREPDNQSLYIKAYSELIVYLRHLFIEYNSKVSDEELRELLKGNGWGWFELLKRMNLDSEYDDISIITYNYDIWLERILNVLEIEYSICGFEDEKCNVKIIKPHGSVSFVPKGGKNQLYKINYKIDSSETDIAQIEVRYEDLDQYDKSYLIPPAGDSSRPNPDTWAETLRECAIKATQGFGDGDDVIICGMSYWHVDRRELDQLLINLNQDINLTLINPNLPKDLNAVLVSLFGNYRVFTSSDTIREACI